MADLSDKVILNRARVRMNHQQTEWPEYREYKTLQAERPDRVDDLLASVRRTREAFQRLKERRQRELPLIMAQVRQDEEMRGLVSPTVRNQVRDKWKKRQEREITIRWMLWNRETLDLIDPIDDAEESYDLEQARKLEWETVARPALVEEFRNHAQNELKFRAGLNPDWVDPWTPDHQEDLRITERKMRKHESQVQW